MICSHFKVREMDCPSELSLIRTKLGAQAFYLEANFERREIWVYHEESPRLIDQAISSLNLNSDLIGSEEVEERPAKNSDHIGKLWLVLMINFSFFLIEILASFWSKSMGLAADGLDMLADALVYGLSLWAIQGSLEKQKITAKLAGYFQIALALIGFAEVLRRVFSVSAAPDFQSMIWVSLAALFANALSLFLLKQSRSDQVAMKASMIFTSNDLIINLGVMASALMVYWFGSAWPDLIVGSFIFILVLWGARRILALAN